MSSTTASGFAGDTPDDDQDGSPDGGHVKDNSQRLPADADEAAAAQRLAEAERAVAAGGGTADDRAALARADTERAPDRRLEQWRASAGSSERASDEVEQPTSRRIR